LSRYPYSRNDKDQARATFGTNPNWDRILNDLLFTLIIVERMRKLVHYKVGALKEA
jgi:hypothetical protein